MTDFAKVRVVRAPSSRNDGMLQVWVEVSSDDGETWGLLPIAETGDGVALRTGKGMLTRIECPIAVTPELGGTVELDRMATSPFAAV